MHSGKSQITAAPRKNNAMRPFSLLLASTLMLSPQAAHATDPAALRKQVDANFDAQWGDLQALYEDLHKNPEVAFQENRTAALLAKRLKALGFEVTERSEKRASSACSKTAPARW
jgi:hippurate hydrolase